MMAKRSGVRRTTPPPSPPPSEEHEPIKRSLLLPPDLDSRVEEVMRLRDIKFSSLIREMITECIETQRLRALGQAPPAAPPGSEPGINVRLQDDLRASLNDAAALWGISAEAAVQLLLTQHLASFVREGRAKRHELEQAREESQDGDSK